MAIGSGHRVQSASCHLLGNAPPAGAPRRLSRDPPRAARKPFLSWTCIRPAAADELKDRAGEVLPERRPCTLSRSCQMETAPKSDSQGWLERLVNR
jgi:hypothetical protein